MLQRPASPSVCSAEHLTVSDTLDVAAAAATGVSHDSTTVPDSLAAAAFFELDDGPGASALALCFAKYAKFGVFAGSFSGLLAGGIGGRGAAAVLGGGRSSVI